MSPVNTTIPLASGEKTKNTVITPHGRAPWYGLDGKPVEAYVIGVAGGSASGKTSVARAILSALDHVPSVLILAQDSFYRFHNAEEIDLAFSNDLDLDHPNAIDTDLFVKCLTDLKHGRATEIPVYSFVHHQRMPDTQYLYGASVIIVEGIMTLVAPELRDLYDLKVFVNCDSDLMLARRIRRDVKERGRDVDGILDQYLRFVKSSYDNFVQPSSKFADIIVPGASNHLAIELLVTHVRRQLDSRSLRFRNKLSKMQEAEGLQLNSHATPAGGSCNEDGTVTLLEETNQLKGIMTILRDRETNRGDFIFYTDRLATLIVEKALTLVQYESKEVQTPLKLAYQGCQQKSKEIIGIAILRSGGPFWQGLRRVIRDAPIGSLLIQSDPVTGEPLLLSSELPTAIKRQEESKDATVFLFDSQIGTGAAALMAIRVLLDHGVQESNIIFLSFLVARNGISTVRRAFPQVRLITAAIDSGLEERTFPFPRGAAQTLGEGTGDGDFSVRVVGLGLETESKDKNGEQAQTTGEGFHLPKGDHEDIKFSRRRHSSSEGVEKRAWIVTPGAGHWGDRYYLK